LDYINYSDKVHAGFPTVSASPTSPATLYHAASDVVFINTGSGWQPGIQPSSNSVYSAVSTASATTKAAVVASVASTVSVPTPVHTAIATKAVNVINNGGSVLI
jgi:hypothetical protein